MSKLLDKVKKALEQDNTIVSEDPAKAQGFSTEYLGYLGLSQSDLKKLERSGMALRGYTQNFYKPGDKLPNGKIAEDLYTGRGHRLRWILTIPKE